MALSTKGNQSNQGLDKKTKIANLLEYHRETLAKLGVTEPLYIPKMIFLQTGAVKVMAFWPSELKQGKDIYTEAVSRDYDSEDETRTLYKWKFRADWKDEKVYAHKFHASAQDPTHIIPISEFEIVELPKEDPADEFDITNPDMDQPISELTIRDLAAILTGKPVSMKSWLNKIVKE